MSNLITWTDLSQLGLVSLVKSLDRVGSNTLQQFISASL